MKKTSIIVCTRNRPNDLSRCLESFKPYYDCSSLEIIVVDNNNPRDLETERIIEQYPVRRLHQPIPGLSRSLNLGIKSAEGEVIVFTDDDVIVNENWIESLLKNFDDPDVAYVSGQVLPFALETDAQILFEFKGGLSKGLHRREFDYHFFQKFRLGGIPVHLVAMGANSAARKTVLEKVGYFDEKFGVGGFINAGNTGELCYRIMREGYKLVYDPTAIVHHYHEPNYKKLRNKLYRYGCADTAQQTKFFIVYRDFRGLPQIFIIKPLQQAKRIIESLIGQKKFPLDLIAAEILGNTVGPFLYLLSTISSITNKG